jgi:hypothetical protein
VVNISVQTIRVQVNAASPHAVNTAVNLEQP